MDWLRSFGDALGASRLLVRSRVPGPGGIRRQVAALPVRLRPGGAPEVLLITTRKSRRLIIPRGWPMAGKTDQQAAAIEAEEEAGVVGFVRPEPIGVYRYRKTGAGRLGEIAVAVYRLDVERELGRWREKGQRQLFWLTPSVAAERIGEPGLVPILKALGEASISPPGSSSGRS